MKIGIGNLGVTCPSGQTASPDPNCCYDSDQNLICYPDSNVLSFPFVSPATGTAATTNPPPTSQNPNTSKSILPGVPDIVTYLVAGVLGVLLIKEAIK